MDIEDLYKLIPVLQCTPGCTECCRRFGVPSRTEVENERIREFLKERHMEAKRREGTSCPYVSKEGCTIYPVRPLICRLYGTSPSYLCILGVSPVELLHEDLETEIFHLYRMHFFGDGRLTRS